MASDFAVFKTMGTQIKQMAAGYDLMWVVEDFEKNLTRELDFTLEATSGEETARQLAHRNPRVYVPKVFKEFSSSRIIVMEYLEGLLKANDPEGLRRAGLDVDECAQLICDTFAEMIFVHGRVHADPHAGNIYFRAIET
ncbi:adck1, partial [Symbiodinium necroappetens]